MSSITWQPVVNSVKRRLNDNPLIHELTKNKKIKRRTKLLNCQLRNQQYNLKNYKHFVEIKTFILRTLSDDENTDDETDDEVINFTDEEKFNESLQKKLNNSGKSVSSNYLLRKSSLKLNNNDDDETIDDPEPTHELDDERIKSEVSSSEESSDQSEDDKITQIYIEKHVTSPEKKINKKNEPHKIVEKLSKQQTLNNHEKNIQSQDLFSQDLFSQDQVDDQDDEIKSEKQIYADVHSTENDETIIDKTLNNETDKNNFKQNEDDKTSDGEKIEQMEIDNSFEIIMSSQVPKESTNKKNSVNKIYNNIVPSKKSRQDIKKNLNKLLDSVDNNTSIESIVESSQQPTVDADQPTICGYLGPVNDNNIKNNVPNHEVTRDSTEDFILPIVVSDELVNENKIVEKNNELNQLTNNPNGTVTDDDSRDNLNENNQNNTTIVQAKKLNPKITSDQVIESKIKIIRSIKIKSPTKILPELSSENSVDYSDNYQDDVEVINLENVDWTDLEKKNKLSNNNNKVVAGFANSQESVINNNTNSIDENNLTIEFTDNEDLDVNHQINKTFIDNSNHSSDEEQLEDGEEEMNQTVLPNDKRVSKKTNDEIDIRWYEPNDVAQLNSSDNEYSEDTNIQEYHEINNEISDNPDEYLNDNNNEFNKKLSLNCTTEADSIKYILNRLEQRSQRSQRDNNYFMEDNLSTNNEAKQSTNKSPEKFIARPTNISDFVEINNLKVEESEASWLINDLTEDYEIWSLEIPKSIFDDNLIGKRIKLKKKKLIIGDNKYNIQKKEIKYLPTVLKSQSKKKPYKIGIIEPYGNIVVTGKCDEVIDQITEQEDPSTTDDLSSPQKQPIFKEPDQINTKKRKKKTKTNNENKELIYDGLTDDSETNQNNISNHEITTSLKKNKRKRKASVLSDDLSDNFTDIYSSDNTESLLTKRKKKKRKYQMIKNNYYIFLLTNFI